MDAKDREEIKMKITSRFTVALFFDKNNIYTAKSQAAKDKKTIRTTRRRHPDRSPKLRARRL